VYTAGGDIVILQLVLNWLISQEFP